MYTSTDIHGVWAMRLGVGAAVVEGELVRGDVEIADGAIASVGLAGGGRGIAAAGFVDLQANGFAGVDFASTDSAGYARAADAMLETGVTAFQPTFITAPEADLVAALQEVPDDPRVLGVHLEGPFLSPTRLGAHPADARRDPDPALLGRLLDAGPVSYMTLAPELPGALDLIDSLHARGIVVSCGHSDATAVDAHAAFDGGARTVTHLFNAMRPLAHRDPGIAGAALAREDVVVQVIVDGVHLAPETVQLVLRAATGRVALVTDAIAAAGNGDGRYRLGGLDVTVHDGVARRDDGVLAGSVLTMIEAVRNLHDLGAPLVQALESASRVPARVLGRDDLGTIHPGARADVVVLDDRLEVSRVLLSGRERVAA
jgi:N-acetylglucosamine-6-phosphate deacetylase